MFSIQKIDLIYIIDLPFLLERMKIKKCSKLAHSLHDKKTRCSHKNLKTSIKNGLIIKKEHRVTQFNQEAWLKPYITK